MANARQGHAHGGLEADLAVMGTLASRRRVLGMLGGAGLLPILGCPDSEAGVLAGADGSTSSGSGTCETIPEETAGPYPGDGSNGPNALALSGIVRSDIRSSIAGVSGTAEGIQLTVRLTLVNRNDACRSLAGYAIYLWHCTRDGEYSMYTLPSQNYLRGVQETDDDGAVTFTTIFPGCYSGRMPHIHFEVYPGLDQATSSASKIKTSQMAFPGDVCDEVYAAAGYEASVRNFAQISFATDNVFSDGVDLQLATLTGSIETGFVAELLVTIED